LPKSAHFLSAAHGGELRQAGIRSHFLHCRQALRRFRGGGVVEELGQMAAHY